MRIKVVFFLACLLASSLLWANGSLASMNLPFPKAYGLDPCELPPPNNFHVEEIGATWVKLAWDAGDLMKHRIRTYRSSDHFLLNTTIEPGGITTATIPIPFNTECYAVINTICEDDSNSPLEANSPPFLGIVVDLIVTGYTNDYTELMCTLSTTSQKCYFIDGQIFPFRIIDVGSSRMRRFGLVHTESDGFDLLFRGYNDGEIFKFYCTNPFDDPTCPSTPNVYVRQAIGNNPETIIAVLEFSHLETTTYNSIYCSYLNSNFQIQALGPGGGGGRPSGPRNNPSTYGTQFLATVPNPFSETLEVFLAQPAAEKIHLQLYNLSGQKVLDQQFAGGQEQYSLSTAGLSAGFYLLRVEADGEVQTLKVVKSE